MRPVFLLIALLMFACAPAPENRATPIEEHATSTEDELAVRQDIGKNVWALFAGAKFDELNKLAEHYRVSGEKTPSGVSKLSLFYLDLRSPPDANKLTSLQWGGIFLITHMWIEQKPSPAANIALANLYIDDGWRRRGVGLADTVSPDQWKAFFSELNLAHKGLDAIKATASNDPEWYASMLMVARGEQWPPNEATALVDEAISKNKYYDPIYFEIMEGLLPQWNGSEEAMERFADYAVDTTKDREGEEMYARLYWHLAGCGCFKNGVPYGDWTKVKAGFHDMLSRYPTAWNMNDYAYFACMEKDKETAKSLLSQMPKPILVIWDDKQQNYDQCKAWAFGA